MNESRSCRPVIRLLMRANKSVYYSICLAAMSEVFDDAKWSYPIASSDDKRHLQDCCTFLLVSYTFLFDCLCCMIWNNNTLCHTMPIFSAQGAFEWNMSITYSMKHMIHIVHKFWPGSRQLFLFPYYYANKAPYAEQLPSQLYMPQTPNCFPLNSRNWSSGLTSLRRQVTSFLWILALTFQ